MKNKILNLLTAGLLVLAGACNDDKWEPVQADGTLDLKSMNLQQGEVEDITSRADGNYNDFIITIFDAQGQTRADWTWTYAKMPEILRLPAANGYSLVVESHKIKPAAFEEPYFKGSQTFNIEQNKITPLGTITCHFSSLKVTVVFAPELKRLMSSDSKATIFMDSDNKLDFGRDETRAGYFKHEQESATLVAQFNGTIDGTPKTEQQLFTDVKPGTHVVVKFGAKNGPDIPDPEGTVNPGIQLDVDFEVVDIDQNVGGGEDIIGGEERPGQEEPDDPNPPTPDDPDQPKAVEFVPVGVKLNTPNTLVEGMEVKVNILCPAGFKNLIVTIDSETLTPDELEAVGLKSSFDLCNPGDLKESLDNLLQINTGEALKGQKEMLFDVSQLVGLLELLGTGQSTFKIEVTDVNGESGSTNLIIDVK